MPRRKVAEANRSRSSQKENGAEARTLDRGLAVLTCFTVDRPCWTIPDLSREVGLHRATTRRLVKTLEGRRFLVADDGTGDYRLGPALFPMTYLVRSHSELVRIAHPYLEELAARTLETIELTVWTDEGILLIDGVATVHYFKPVFQFDSVVKKYGSPHSKIFLAFGPEERRSRLSFGSGDQLLTLADMAAVQAELDLVAKTGVAYDLGKSIEGTYAVGVPVRDATGEVVASITVISPPDRFGPAQQGLIVARAVETGRALSRELGFQGAEG